MYVVSFSLKCDPWIFVVQIHVMYCTGTCYLVRRLHCLDEIVFFCELDETVYVNDFLLRVAFHFHKPCIAVYL
jgi:hypothetical protein